MRIFSRQLSNGTVEYEILRHDDPAIETFFESALLQAVGQKDMRMIHILFSSWSQMCPWRPGISSRIA